MAKDLMRMLTEITPTQQPVAGTPGFRGMFGQQQAQRLQGSLGRVARGGAPSRQQQLTAALGSLRSDNPEDLMKLAKIQQGTGDFAGAVKTTAAAKELQQDTNIRTSLLRIARTQGNNQIVDFLEQGGDLRTASSVLFRAEKAPEKPRAPATLSSEEIKNYDSILDNYLGTIKNKNNWPESVSVEGRVYGRNKKKTNELRPIFLKAEELRRENPDLPMQTALLQAMGVAPTTPAGKEQETAVTPGTSSSADMFQGAPIESERG
jgi:hypothetical protein